MSIWVKGSDFDWCENLEDGGICGCYVGLGRETSFGSIITQRPPRQRHSEADEDRSQRFRKQNTTGCTNLRTLGNNRKS